jgi:ATPase subunit of ABC transporter with duplicated ATPase domains
MSGSLAVRKKNAEKRRITKGQSLSVRKPGVMETLYDVLDAPLAALARRLGMSEGEAYEYSKRLSGGEVRRVVISGMGI